jgi:hypothetical protein
MSITITELKTLVIELPPRELDEFTDWFNEFQEAQWDKEIETDIKSGKLDHLIQQAEKALSEGKCKEI